jgi:hypothetical protein
MTMLLEQQPARTMPREAPLGQERQADRVEEISRRALILAHTYIFSKAEVSPARQAVAWIALTICFAVLILLALGV